MLKKFLPVLCLLAIPVLGRVPNLPEDPEAARDFVTELAVRQGRKHGRQEGIMQGLRKVERAQRDAGEQFGTRESRNWGNFLGRQKGLVAGAAQGVQEAQAEIRAIKPDTKFLSNTQSLQIQLDADPIKLCSDIAAKSITGSNNTTPTDFAYLNAVKEMAKVDAGANVNRAEAETKGRTLGTDQGNTEGEAQAKSTGIAAGENQERQRRQNSSLTDRTLDLLQSSSFEQPDPTRSPYFKDDLGSNNEELNKLYRELYLKEFINGAATGFDEAVEKMASQELLKSQVYYTCLKNLSANADEESRASATARANALKEYKDSFQSFLSSLYSQYQEAARQAAKDTASRATYNARLPYWTAEGAKNAFDPSKASPRIQISSVTLINPNKPGDSYHSPGTLLSINVRITNDGWGDERAPHTLEVSEIDPSFTLTVKKKDIPLIPARTNANLVNLLQLKLKRNVAPGTSPRFRVRILNPNKTPVYDSYLQTYTVAAFELRNSFPNMVLNAPAVNSVGISVYRRAGDPTTVPAYLRIVYSGGLTGGFQNGNRYPLPYIQGNSKHSTTLSFTINSTVGAGRSGEVQLVEVDPDDQQEYVVAQQTFVFSTKQAYVPDPNSQGVIVVSSPESARNAEIYLENLGFKLDVFDERGVARAETELLGLNNSRYDGKAIIALDANVVFTDEARAENRKRDRVFLLASPAQLTHLTECQNEKPLLHPIRTSVGETITIFKRSQFAETCSHTPYYLLSKNPDERDVEKIKRTIQEAVIVSMSFSEKLNFHQSFALENPPAAHLKPMVEAVILRDILEEMKEVDEAGNRDFYRKGDGLKTSDLAKFVTHNTRIEGTTVYQQLMAMLPEIEKTRKSLKSQTIQLAAGKILEPLQKKKPGPSRHALEDGN